MKKTKNMKYNNTVENHWKLLVLMLKEILAQKEISYEEVERLTGVKSTNVSRLLNENFKHAPNLRTLILIADAAGVKLTFVDDQKTVDLQEVFKTANIKLLSKA